MHRKLLFNQESKQTSLCLCMSIACFRAGVANTLVGILGVGYTGSYIFSQTVFTMRAGVYNRLNGLVVAAVEVTVFMLPFSVVQV
jgi:MFS superfamily sulfate permease-like transporter